MANIPSENINKETAHPTDLRTIRLREDSLSTHYDYNV